MAKLVFAEPMPLAGLNCPVKTLAMTRNTRAAEAARELKPEKKLGFDVAAAECGFALGDAECVEHAVTIEDVVGSTREELRVGPVSDVRAVEARRDGAFHDFALRGREFIDGGEVLREHVSWVHSTRRGGVVLMGVGMVFKVWVWGFCSIPRGGETEDGSGWVVTMMGLESMIVDRVLTYAMPGNGITISYARVSICG
ncbi:hypothetical protein CR513_28962, partial [Mucuna pruriens]